MTSAEKKRVLNKALKLGGKLMDVLETEREEVVALEAAIAIEGRASLHLSSATR
jgi:hypothetical protein